MDATLPRQPGNGVSHLAPRQLFDHLFQFRVFLAYNFVELHRLHARFLKLREDATGFHRFMLARVAHQQNTVVRM